jgi:RNA polymerase sigma factor (sigma-70 family)
MKFLRQAGTRELVARAVAGDDAAWTQLIRSYEPIVHRVARAHRLAAADVEDVAQTVWMRLFERIQTLRDPGALPAWLRTVARHEALRVLGRPGHEELPDDPEQEPSAHTDGPAELVLAREARAVLAQALTSLPDRQRKLMTLLAAHPTVDYRQVSATLAMPVGSIGPIRARSLRRLERHPGLRMLHACSD